MAKLLNANNELKMLHKAIGISDGGFTHIRYQGKSFPTIKSLAKYLSIPPKVLAERLKRGFLNISSNSILIKLNQIGTVSETLDVIRFAQTIGYKTIISHR